MENKISKEVASKQKERLSGKLEGFARSPEFQKIFETGLSSHIQVLKKENQPTEDEIPDISEALEIYSDLEDVVKSGFKGLVFRNFRHTASGWACTSMARKEDLSREDPSRFDFSE